MEYAVPRESAAAATRALVARIRAERIPTAFPIEFRFVKSPYDDGEELVAMPALVPDIALIHAHRSDERGNLLTLSKDPLFDELLVRAAGKSYATVEKIVPTAELNMEKNSRYNLVERAMITGVAEAPLGAHPTSADPDYQLDLGHIKTYVGSAASPKPTRPCSSCSRRKKPSRASNPPCAVRNGARNGRR